MEFAGYERERDREGGREKKARAESAPKIAYRAGGKAITRERISFIDRNGSRNTERASKCDNEKRCEPKRNMDDCARELGL